MCDTLGKLYKGVGFFAKNSDRSPNEIQIMEYHPPLTNLSGCVQCTYLSIPQVSQTYGVLLSRPEWMWGAEMGVNEFGLCIGNEAVFTRGAYGKSGLTGMDMVRLALERSKTAAEALQLLITLLETYGQGGDCGFDHHFYYDNAFLIMDRQDLYVLETAGKEWVCKHQPSASISNGLSIGIDGSAYSAGAPVDFRKKYTEPVYTTFSGSKFRRLQTASCLETICSEADCMNALRQHHSNCKNPFTTGSVKSVCMHYGGLVGDHTTSSMVVTLAPDRTVVWTTGSSVPCVSLFKPWLFGSQEILPIAHKDSSAPRDYWLNAEQFRRGLLGKELPSKFYAERDQIQNRWVEEVQTLTEKDFAAFSLRCLDEEDAFFRKWSNTSLNSAPCSAGFLKRWHQKNAVLGNPIPNHEG